MTNPPGQPVTETVAGSDSMLGRPFLLEVGSEELPARFVPPALEHLRRRGAELLAEHGLAAAGMRVYGTPRRLCLLCATLAEHQPDRAVELKGPPLAVAYDADGRPTAAGLGFARKSGVPLEACETLEDARGAYLVARRVEPGRPAAEVLAGLIPELVLGIPFPKVMRWGESDLEYARPLQWLAVLHGEDVVPVHLGDLIAGRRTRGHRTLAGNRWLELPDAATYLDRLREVGVVADPAERTALMHEGIKATLAGLTGGGIMREDPELFQEVLHLCEHPTPFLGTFDVEFFALPDEVIVTALRAHQRYFAVTAPAGSRLEPCFISVRDGGTADLEIVRRGNERVLRARLADALFYWKFDQQRSPDAQVARLASVTWLEGFGSLRDKTERLVRLADLLWVGGLGDGGPPPPALGRAAFLCKSDLVSEMIRDGKEFTRLEGIMGAHYARQAGEPAEVCRTIERHTMPRGAGTELPGDRMSSVLAAADRLDNLAGCWLAGFAPTGAKDPYALRRQALALLRIVLDLQARIHLASLLENALAAFADLASETDRERAAGELREFVLTRLAVHLVDTLGTAPEVVRAVLPAHGDDPTDAKAWAQALGGFRDRKDFLQLATGFKRCKNILEGEFLLGDERRQTVARWRRGGEGADGSSLADLSEPAERELLAQVAGALPELLEAEECGDYAAVFRQLSAFGPAIDRFFDAVRVNVADDEIRRRRHAFLREIHALFARYADFSEVVPLES
jgi:glycyl-tRNA synthetase beta chain